ncbi:MAG: Tat pathway signal protein [Veillonella sp.]|nr:Tat pathway signal protein [Veillonella sp.]
MNQYIKFIVRVLLTCFFIAFLGVIIQVTCGLQHYVWGWLWGIFIMVLYLLSLALHGQAIILGDPYKAVRKARRQMVWRLMLVGSLVVLGLKILHVEAISMFVAIALIQPALYIVYWRLSGRF